LRPFEEDTIAAIATPFGTAGIGKIRISGPEAISIADRIFQGVKGSSLKLASPYSAHYGYIIDLEKRHKVDEIIAILMKRPHSFTGEDVVEFDCHGGMVPLQRVLEIILANGVRLAEPGEFSKRSFLNGRIDLAQAEAIIELINSKTERGMDIALNHLTGKLSGKIRIIKDELIKLLAHLEATVDFPEDEIEGFDSSKLFKKIDSIRNEIEKLLSTSKEGKIYQEGIKTIIVGKPNVGKSSLLNTLLKEKRAIVTDIPGTTRDTIEEFINIKGIPLKVIDTAGIRETKDVIEKIGLEKTYSSLKESDLVILMLDVNQGLTIEDIKVYNLIKDKPLIVVVNKTDLEYKLDEEDIKKRFIEHTILWVSIKEEKGLEDLKEAIISEVFEGNVNTDDNTFITRIRHKDALKKSLQAIIRVKESLIVNMPYDFLTIDLKDSLDYLGQITGETVTEDIIDRIFADFCLGK
jgi:tRNA modification GTPase